MQPHRRLYHRINTIQYLCNLCNDCTHDFHTRSNHFHWQTSIWSVPSNSSRTLEIVFLFYWTHALYSRTQQIFCLVLSLSIEWKIPINYEKVHKLNHSLPEAPPNWTHWTFSAGNVLKWITGSSFFIENNWTTPSWSPTATWKFAHSLRVNAIWPRMNEKVENSSHLLLMLIRARQQFHRIHQSRSDRTVIDSIQFEFHFLPTLLSRPSLFPV